MKIYKFSIDSDIINSNLLLADPAHGIFQIDINSSKKLVRIVSNRATAAQCIEWAQKRGFCLEQIEESEQKKALLSVSGMTCHSCEVTLERRLNAIPGIVRTDANASKGTIHISYQGDIPEADIQAAVAEEGYRVQSIGRHTLKQSVNAARRVSLSRIAGFAALAFMVGTILSTLNLLNPTASFGDTISYGAAFFVGLFAASSSCIAVSGGLLLSSSAQWNKKYGTEQGIARMQPVFFFIFGRVLSYLAFGALIGFIGNALSPTPLVTGILTIAVAVFMVGMGLDMIGYAPHWMRRLVPRMPKRFSHFVLQQKSSQSPIAPLLFGAATFFLPCGFTQSLQLYALTTGSTLTSALLLAFFALGTAPSLFALGWASTSLKGKAGAFFFQFSGVVVIMLGLWNVQNGFAAAGYPLSLPRLAWNSSEGGVAADSNVVFDGKTQTVRMTADKYGYSPNRITVRAGIPVKWIVDGTKADGCVSVFQAPQLGIKKLLSRGENVFEFTPDTPGTYAFSCSMGMYRGAITVVPNT